MKGQIERILKELGFSGFLVSLEDRGGGMIHIRDTRTVAGYRMSVRQWHDAAAIGQEEEFIDDCMVQLSIFIGKITKGADYDYLRRSGGS